jgi:hypothetical protein
VGGLVGLPPDAWALAWPIKGRRPSAPATVPAAESPRHRREREEEEEREKKRRSPADFFSRVFRYLNFYLYFYFFIRNINLRLVKPRLVVDSRFNLESKVQIRGIEYI